MVVHHGGTMGEFRACFGKTQFRYSRFNRVLRQCVDWLRLWIGENQSNQN
jgi:hypothetical protein